jgi:hypothetical protein
MTREPLTRRRMIKTAAFLGAAGGVALLTHAADGPPTIRSTDDMITPDTESAINRGLDFLSQSQAADGSFSGERGAGANVGVTALAALALLSGGHQPGKGKYGRVVSKAADYIISRGKANTPNGFLCSSPQADGHSAMYQHGFGALFLAELHGTFPDEDRRSKTRDMLERAIALTIKAQNNKGGWRYNTEPRDDDVSVSVAHLMALRAAKNAGVMIEKTVVDKAVGYIKSCQTAEGGYSYMPNAGPEAFPRSAAAVVGLYCAGVYDGTHVEKGLKYLLRHIPSGQRATFQEFRQEHFYYGHYYAALAMWTAGGNYWAQWFPAIRNELLKKRDQSNVWSDQAFGSVYATALACIILQLPNNYLPIMQK